MIDELQEQMGALDVLCKESKSNYERALKRIKALEATNQELLSSLGESIRTALIPPVGIIINAEPKPLSHTPHFLMKADKSGLA
jgi:cell shape-determining protein MreC